MLTHLSLTGRSENRGLQAGTIHQASRQLHTSNLTGLVVHSQTRTGQVTAHNALHREHVQGAANHRATSHNIRNVSGQHMVRNLLKLLKPPQGHLSQNLALIRNLGRQNTVKSANTVRGNNHDRTGTQLSVIIDGQAGSVKTFLIRNVQVADLTGINVSPARDFHGVRTRSHENFS